MQMKKAYSLLKILGVFLVGWALQPPLVAADPFNDPQPDPIVDDDLGTTSHCRSHLKIYDDCKDRKDRDYIKVWTKNCRPYRRDWIGLHKDTGRREVGRSRGEYYWKDTDDWMHVCGSKNIDYCDAWYKKYNWFDEYRDKLSTGNYKFYLFSNDGYYVKAESETFRVEKSGKCSDTEEPTYSPTESPTPAPTRCRNRGGYFQLQWRSRWRNCSWARRYNTSYRCTWRIKHPFRGTVADGKLGALPFIHIFRSRFFLVCSPSSHTSRFRLCLQCYTIPSLPIEQTKVCPVVCGICKKPTRNPTRSPTLSPTESRDPTLSPTESLAPSDIPSISHFPTLSNFPSQDPTA